MSLDTNHERFDTEIRKHLSTLESSKLKRLYKLLVAETVFLAHFNCHPAYRAPTSHLDFRFILKSDLSKNCFALKVCSDRLEFYFRKPAMEYFGREAITQIFPNLKFLEEGYVNEAFLNVDSELTLSNLMSMVRKFPA